MPANQLILPGNRVLYALMALIVLFLVAMIMEPASLYADQGRPSMPKGLRGLFVAPQEEHGAESNIGRLGVILLHNGFEVPVGIDHPFKHGDQFRLEVTAKRSGWLFVFHRQSDQEPKLVWPRENASESKANNAIFASQPVLVPPRPLSFHFDEQSGRETITIVITPENKKPELAVARREESQMADSGPSRNRTMLAQKDRRIDEIVNFTIRGRHFPETTTIQSLVSYPGVNDDDKYIYFRSTEDAGKTVTVMEFQLRHE